MIKCQKCDSTVDYNGGLCSICKEKLNPTEAEIASAKSELFDPKTAKNPTRLIALRKFLAEMGDTESEREYAKYLERADEKNRDYDRAIKYYYSAAKKNDPFSAYRYSKLIASRDEDAAVFWLKFSALLGCPDSYSDLGDYFSAAGDEWNSAYYDSLAADGGNTEAIITMAKRYFGGIGVVANRGAAKWYLDKFKIPPIGALKLAYKLHSITPEEPAPLSHINYEEYLAELMDDAERFGFDTSRYFITATLAKLRGVKYYSKLGVLLAEGIGCDKEPQAAYALLDEAVNASDSYAMMYIGDAYNRRDSFLDYNPEASLAYFRRAIYAGEINAYERLGDVIRSGEHDISDGLPTPNIPLAIQFYRDGAEAGSNGAKAKYIDMISRRDSYFERGIKTLESKDNISGENAEAAFRSLVMASAYGKTEAHSMVAKCYARGLGCPENHTKAYEYFHHAVHHGDRSARLPLGLCYSRGFGVNRNYRLAREHLTVAANDGSAEARAELAELKRRKIKKAVRSLYAFACELIYKKKYETARAVLEQTESIGYPRALYTLGCMYEFGIGTLVNKKTALAYYAKAKTGGERFAAFSDPGAKYKSRFLKIIKMK